MTMTQTAKWWRTAPNPTCSPWCRGGHEADEFARGAAMLCCATVLEREGVQIDLQQLHSGDDIPVGEIQSEAPNVYFELEALHFEFVPFDVAIEVLGSALMAVQHAKAMAEGRA